MTKTINVTQEHIDKGNPRGCNTCPVALAFRSNGFFAANVWLSKCYLWETSNDSYQRCTRSIKTPEEVKHFITDFDEGKPVKPFSFEIEIDL